MWRRVITKCVRDRLSMTWCCSFRNAARARLIVQLDNCITSYEYGSSRAVGVWGYPCFDAYLVQQDFTYWTTGWEQHSFLTNMCVMMIGSRRLGISLSTFSSSDTMHGCTHLYTRLVLKMASATQRSLQCCLGSQRRRVLVSSWAELCESLVDYGNEITLIFGVKQRANRHGNDIK